MLGFRRVIAVKDKKYFEDLINSTHKENKEELEIFTAEWFNEQAKEDINYNIYPDNLEKFEGLISPNGDFYSCDFGGHNIKAYHLCLMNKDKWNITEDFTMDNAFDLLLKKGWCATRFLPSTGTYLTAPMKLTKEQINTIYDLMIKFDEHLDMSNYLED